MAPSVEIEPEVGPSVDRLDYSRSSQYSSFVNTSVIEWCFVVSTHGGKGEVRVRSNGEVVFAHGDPKWVSLDGIVFPTEETPRTTLERRDVRRLAASGIKGRDRVLYHYTSAETAADFILNAGTLRLGEFSKTNDPRENKDWVFAVVAEKGVLPPGKSIDLSERLGGLLRSGARLACFCVDPPSATRPLSLSDGRGWGHARMWAQYGGHHSGVVLAFDQEKLLANAAASLGGRGSLLFGDVLYVDHNHAGDMWPFVVEYERYKSVGESQFAREHLENHGDWLFFTKHLDWSQESETRLVLFSEQQSDAFVPVDGALLEVCLGEEVDPPIAVKLASLGRAKGASVSRVLWRNGLPIRTPVEI